MQIRSKGLMKSILLRLKRRSAAVTAESRNELLYKKLASFKPIVDAVEQAVLGLRDASDGNLQPSLHTWSSGTRRQGDLKQAYGPSCQEIFAVNVCNFLSPFRTCICSVLCLIASSLIHEAQVMP